MTGLPTTNSGNLELLLAVCREERDKLPQRGRTTGEAIHGLVIEVLGHVILRAMKKKEQGLC